MMGKGYDLEAAKDVARCATCHRVRRCRSVPHPVVSARAGGGLRLSFHLLPCCRECREQFLDASRERLARFSTREVIAAWRKKYDQVWSEDEVMGLLERCLVGWSHGPRSARRPPVFLSAGQQRRLEAHGIRNPRDLLSMAAVPGMARHLAATLEISEEEFGCIVGELREGFPDQELQDIERWESLDGRLGDLGQTPCDLTGCEGAGQDGEEHHRDG
jgi:hypothetical protein